MTWFYNNETIDNIDIKQFPTFVYIITNLLDKRFYIGYKQTSFTKTKQIKGKKKRYQAESDWRDYWSSSEELKSDVVKLGRENFRREILYLCSSKSMASYLEAREQFERKVLENPEMTYNRIINVRVSYNHLKNVLHSIKILGERNE